jgi:hypothetical protein
MKRAIINHFGKVYELDFDSEEFNKARELFFKRLHELAEKKDPRVGKGLVGATLNDTTKDIPFPFGCPKLEIYLWGKDDGGPAIAYFCSVLGCLCSPCRGEDFLEDYINRSDKEWHCPDPEEDREIESEEGIYENRD